MRVMHLVLSLEIGGMERLVHDLVRSVDRTQYLSQVCCLDAIGTFGEALRADGHTVHVVERRPGRDWSLIPRLSTLFARERVHVVHAQQRTTQFYAVLAKCYMRLRRLGPIPRLAFTVHGVPFPYRLRLAEGLLNRALALGTDSLVTISEDTRAILGRYHWLPTSRVRVIYNGVSPCERWAASRLATMRSALMLPAGAEVVGIVARLDPVKNHPLLFRAFKAILPRFPLARLLVVGGGTERESLAALAAELGISGSVVFAGPRPDAKSLFQVCDVAVLPSLVEGMSVTLLEAMAAGVPVIATRVGGNPEVVQDGITGYLVPSGDVQAMTAALVRLLGDPALRVSMGHAAEVRVHERFSAESMVNAYRDLYAELCEGRLHEVGDPRRA